MRGDAGLSGARCGDRSIAGSRADGRRCGCRGGANAVPLIRPELGVAIGAGGAEHAVPRVQLVGRDAVGGCELGAAVAAVGLGVLAAGGIDAGLCGARRGRRAPAAAGGSRSRSAGHADAVVIARLELEAAVGAAGAEHRVPRVQLAGRDAVRLGKVVAIVAGLCCRVIVAVLCNAGLRGGRPGSFGRGVGGGGDRCGGCNESTRPAALLIARIRIGA